MILIMMLGALRLLIAYNTTINSTNFRIFSIIFVNRIDKIFSLRTHFIANSFQRCHRISVRTLTCTGIVVTVNGACFQLSVRFYFGHLWRDLRLVCRTRAANVVLLCAPRRTNTKMINFLAAGRLLPAPTIYSTWPVTPVIHFLQIGWGDDVNKQCRPKMPPASSSYW
jgi:hypothetical protein